MIAELSGDFLQKLRGFYYVARCGSISAAAREMHRNQSTVSQQIKLLEEELGAPLLRRGAQGTALTAQGEQLFSLALNIFESIRMIRAQVGKAGQEGQVKVGISPIAQAGFLPRHLEGLRKAFPAMLFTFRQSAGIASMLKSLENGELDFCIGPQGPLPQQLEYRHLYASRLLLITPEGMQPDLGQPPDMARLAALPHICPTEKGAITQMLTQALLRHDLELNVRHQTDSLTLQRQMVRAGFGVAVVDENLLADDRARRGLSLWSLGELFPPRRFGLILRRDAWLPPQVRAVADFLQEAVASEPDGHDFAPYPPCE